MTSKRSTDQSGLRELDGRIEGYLREEEALVNEISFLERQILAFQDRLASVMEQRENIASVREEMQVWVANKRAQIQAAPEDSPGAFTEDPTLSLKAVFDQAQVSSPLTVEGALSAADLPFAPGFDDALEGGQPEPTVQSAGLGSAADLPGSSTAEAPGDEIPLGFDGGLDEMPVSAPSPVIDDCPPGFDDSVLVPAASEPPVKPKDGSRDEFEFGF